MSLRYAQDEPPTLQVGADFAPRFLSLSVGAAAQGLAERLAKGRRTPLACHTIRTNIRENRLALGDLSLGLGYAVPGSPILT